MSYNVTGSGHGVDGSKAKRAFAAFVQALDDATTEGGTPFDGTISGSEPKDGGGYVSFSLSASGVRAGALKAEGEDDPTAG